MKTPPTLTFTIPLALRKRLIAAAKNEGRTISSFLRFYLDQKLPKSKRGARRP